jgi:AraC-like DNA-binding protein
MRHLDIKPAEKLRHVIDSFWYLSVDFDKLPPAGLEILPDGNAEIIFYFGNVCSMLTPGGRQTLPSPFLTGLLNSPIHLHGDGMVQVIGVKCYPWTVFELLGLSSNQGGVRVFEHPIAGLQSSLKELINTEKIKEALNLVQRFFLDSTWSESDLLLKAGNAMRQANGTQPVSHVAEAAHATVRTLERLFKQAAGYTVKDVSGLMRFEQVRDHLWCNPDASIAALAQQMGYADQSHLGRDFKRYAGVTVAAFARKVKQNRQAADGDFVAFVLS